MEISERHIAILVHNYFEQSELEGPLDAMADAGLEITVISASDTTELTAMHGADKGDAFRADVLLKDTTPAEYAALILPGGVINADKLRMIRAAQNWIKDFFDTNRPVAAICHAPWLLVSADVVEGRRLTSYYTLQDDIRNAGGEWSDFPLIVDGNLITSRKPEDLPVFCEAILAKLKRSSPRPTSKVKL